MEGSFQMHLICLDTPGFRRWLAGQNQRTQLRKCIQKFPGGITEMVTDQNPRPLRHSTLHGVGRDPHRPLSKFTLLARRRS